MSERIVRAALIGPWLTCVLGWATWVAVHEVRAVVLGD